MHGSAVKGDYDRQPSHRPFHRRAFLSGGTPRVRPAGRRRAWRGDRTPRRVHLDVPPALGRPRGVQLAAGRRRRLRRLPGQRAVRVGRPVRGTVADLAVTMGDHRRDRRKPRSAGISRRRAHRGGAAPMPGARPADVDAGHARRPRGFRLGADVRPVPRRRDLDRSIRPAALPVVRGRRSQGLRRRLAADGNLRGTRTRSRPGPRDLRQRAARRRATPQRLLAMDRNRLARSGSRDHRHRGRRRFPGRLCGAARVDLQRRRDGCRGHHVAAGTRPAGPQLRLQLLLDPRSVLRRAGRGLRRCPPPARRRGALRQRTRARRRWAAQAGLHGHGRSGAPRAAPGPAGLSRRHRHDRQPGRRPVPARRLRRGPAVAGGRRPPGPSRRPALEGGAVVGARPSRTGGGSPTPASGSWTSSAGPTPG